MLHVYRGADCELHSFTAVHIADMEIRSGKSKGPLKRIESTVLPSHRPWRSPSLQSKNGLGLTPTVLEAPLPQSPPTSLKRSGRPMAAGKTLALPAATPSDTLSAGKESPCPLATETLAFLLVRRHGHQASIEAPQRRLSLTETEVS